MTDVLAPVAGRVVALAEVPDAVFAGQLVGAGVALEPSAPPVGSSLVEVVSPVDGVVVKLHPHAFVVVAASGEGVLVHVGIDTVKLGGAGFTLAVAEGATVAAGDLVVSVDPVVVSEAGYSLACPVVVLDSAPDSADQSVVGSTVATGERLFSL